MVALFIIVFDFIISNPPVPVFPGAASLLPLLPPGFPAPPPAPKACCSLLDPFPPGPPFWPPSVAALYL